ncbi:MAG: thiamine-phosphate kinase [Deferrisomatales bacterium]
MAETVADLGEFGLIHRLDELLRREGVRGEGTTLGIGDDTASFRPRPGWEVLVTCDCMVEGRHYLAERTRPRAVGRRAMTMNISDIGAMGGVPRYALVSLGLTAATPVADVEELYRGFVEELNPFGASVIGGNVTRTEGANFIDITLIGEAEPDAVLRRSTARPGEAVLVTGFPGHAAAGLQGLLRGLPADREPWRTLVGAYHQPTHRAREGRAVARSGCASAMIDVSDGLLGDLGHICEDSGVGAELYPEGLPVSEALREAARQLGLDPLDLVLGDSDDYELVITCPPDRVEGVRAAIASVSAVPVFEVGRTTEDAGALHLVLPDGRRPLGRRGWDHFAK